ncbi:MAG TPA: sodium:proton exchanger [Actinomycetes bacterium]
MPTLDRGDRLLLALSAALTAAAAITRYVPVNAVVAFVVSAAAIAVLAALVGRAVDQLAERMNPGATGVLQSALGNLPELFIALFALRAGLLQVATSAVIGSILANILLVLGLAFVVGGLRHGTQRFSAPPARLLVTLMLLSVGVMLLPSLTGALHTPAASHEVGLSRIAAVVLLLVFAASVPASLKASAPDDRLARERPQARWSLGFAVTMLTVSGVLAAVVSDWFVTALQPAIVSLHMSQTFAGLVVVAIAGNAVENVVGLRLAAQDRLDYALSIILNSPVQIALVLAPLLVLLSPLVGGVAFTLVFAPLLMASVFIAMLVVTVIVLDGESTWPEGVALVGLYVVVAASFWWG